MELLVKFLLIVHVTGGMIGLLIGSLVMYLKKGDKRHRLLGKIFAITMLSAATSALILAYLNPNYFLFIIGVWTIYMILTGYRALSFKKEQKANYRWFDFLISGGMFCMALIFLTLGVLNLLRGNLFGVVFVVFSSLALLMVYQDRMFYRGKSKFKNNGLIIHLQRMIGTYIASATAFLVVNNTFLPAVMAWLLPTVVLVPLIMKWSKKYGIALSKVNQ